MAIEKLIDRNVLKLLSGKDLTVSFDNSGRMSTDNVKIYLPAEMETSSSANAIRGALDHETAHVKWSDWDILGEISPRLKGCLNLLEDLRIDHMRRLEGKGYQINNESLTRWIAERIRTKIYEGEKVLREDLLAAFQLLEDIAGYENPFRDKMNEKAYQMAEVAQPLALEAIQKENTQEVLPLAIELDRLWYGAPEEEEKVEGPGSDGSPGDNKESGDGSDKQKDKQAAPDSDQDNGENGGNQNEDQDQDSKDEGKVKVEVKVGKSGENDSSSDGNDDGSEDSASSSETDDASGDESSGSEDGSDDSGGDSGEDSAAATPDSSEGEPLVHDGSNELKDSEMDATSYDALPGGGVGATSIGILVDDSDGLLFEYMEPPVRDVMDGYSGSVYTCETSRDVEVYAPDDGFAHSEYNAVKSEVSNLINGLKQDFLSSVYTETRARFQRKLYSGKVDSRSLASINVDPRVFKRRANKRDLDTVLSYLVDLSGSMAGEKEKLARASAILLSEVTDRLDIPFEVLGFTSTGREVGNRFVTRQEGVLHVIYKDFNESYRRVRHRLGRLKVDPLHGVDRYGCNNCDGEAVLWASRRLYARPEKRKILIVLSDGEPAIHSKSIRLLETHLKQMIQLARVSGIEVYAIGLVYDPSQFYGKEYTVVMKNTSQFTIQFFKSFTSILRKGIGGRK